MDLRPTTLAQTYASARQAIAPQPMDEDAAPSFAAAVAGLSQTLTQAETTARDAMLGNGDPHALVEALSASALAVETVVTVRDKVVEAYQELMRMPV
ncbi:MAG: flagellar hook-basal body protein FliE [Rhodobacteraceae bacterium GWE1_64_9]|nr:MAG: flagellar hook-basal body protein FliE [Rhodobacteraceae bacterium GWE1_64_9]OHC50937.1 MAG: flagellar hook-basal body protein FliE [Rhodobacteraceae bacterium GWF1_65_7]HBD90484.1 flagellar hook-basal body protein FliE [Gemmobacter sp.]HBU15354.1 flagellar hook-basal body protein FliE [Gemmobacter sp.]